MRDPDELRRLRHAFRDDVLGLELDEVADLDAVLDATVRVLDRRRLHAELLADQRREVRHRAALLPGEHRAQGLSLLLRGVRVHEDAHAPVALDHHPGRVGEEREAEPADVDPVDLAVVDVEDEYDATPLLIGGEQEAARTTGAQDVAVAVLEIGAVKAPGHPSLPRQRPRASDSRARRGARQPAGDRGRRPRRCSRTKSDECRRATIGSAVPRPDTSEQPAEPLAAITSDSRRVLALIGAVVAPTTLVTAIAFYFG